MASRRALVSMRDKYPARRALRRVSRIRCRCFLVDLLEADDVSTPMSTPSPSTFGMPMKETFLVKVRASVLLGTAVLLPRYGELESCDHPGKVLGVLNCIIDKFVSRATNEQVTDVIDMLVQRHERVTLG